nr:hypothetical protein [uncultured Psychroserpens sp.]
MKHFYIATVLLMSAVLHAQEMKQDTLPYYELPAYSQEFTAGTVAARMVDALGFRFYWSSHNLTEKDLAYSPSENVRTGAETIDHILDLSYVIVNSTLKKANDKIDSSTLTYHEKRKQVLINLKTAADILRLSDDISQYKIIFGDTEIPFWNQINGPIADAIWHCGQLASFRRATGNPINSKVNHFRGTVKQ